MKNVLLVIRTNGDENPIRHALIPKNKLQFVKLEEINGKEVQDRNVSEEIKDVIVDLYQRLNLEPSDAKKDLAQYLDPRPPFTVDEICYISWAI